MKIEKRPCSVFECLAWTVSFHVAQLLVLLAFSACFITAAYGTRLPEISELVHSLSEPENTFLFIGVSSLGALFIVVPLIRLRLGKRFRERIGWRTPRHEEVIYATATVLPIAVIGNVLYSAFQASFSNRPMELFHHNTDTLHLLRESVAGVPYPILVVALALGPAIGEELVFRGVIGRSLVRRWGPWTGSLVTCLLFAAAHLSPAHAVGTLPIAVLLQFLYLKTGTIWIPVLIHFFNNLLSVSMMRFQFSPQIPLPEPLAFCVFLLYLSGLLLAYEWRRSSWISLSN